VWILISCWNIAFPCSMLSLTEDSRKLYHFQIYKMKGAKNRMEIQNVLWNHLPFTQITKARRACPQGNSTDFSVLIHWRTTKSFRERRSYLHPDLPSIDAWIPFNFSSPNPPCSFKTEMIQNFKKHKMETDELTIALSVTPIIAFWLTQRNRNRRLHPNEPHIPK
jgi:hypothetical protein